EPALVCGRLVRARPGRPQQPVGHHRDDKDEDSHGEQEPQRRVRPEIPGHDRSLSPGAPRVAPRCPCTGFKITLLGGLCRARDIWGFWPTYACHIDADGLAAWRRPSLTGPKEATTVTKQVRQLDRVVIRFAGDSGDGMQLTGDRFTSETAQLGNDISPLPNLPAEIRAPAA